MQCLASLWGWGMGFRASCTCGTSTRSLQCAQTERLRSERRCQDKMDADNQGQVAALAVDVAYDGMRTTQRHAHDGMHKRRGMTGPGTGQRGRRANLSASRRGGDLLAGIHSGSGGGSRWRMCRKRANRGTPFAVNPL